MKNKYFLCVIVFLAQLSIIIPLKAENAKEPQCAQSCVHFICLLNGVPISMEQICQIIPPKEEGESLYEIKKAIEYIGFRAEGKHLSFEQLLQESFPLIVHMNNNHFMVVEEITESHVLVFDFITKRQLITYSDFKGSWTGNTLCIYNGGDVEIPSFLKKKHKAPFIKFQTLFLDIGDITEDQKEVTFKYPFKNIGKSDLKILKVKTNCGCAVGDFPKEPIKPGDSGEISVIYSVASQAGPFGKECVVVSNDPDFEIIKLYLAGNTKKELRLSPSGVYFSPVLYGQTETQNVYIHYWGTEPLTFGDSQTDINGLDFSIDNSCAEDFMNLHDNASVQYPGYLENLSGFFTVKLTYSPVRNKDENMNGKLSILTNLERRPVINIPIHIKTFSTIKTTPPILFWGEIWPEKELEQEITISSRNKHTITVETIDTGDTQISYEIKKLGKGKSRIIFKGIVSEKNMSSLLDNLINVKVKCGQDESTIQIPVSSYLKN